MSILVVVILANVVKFPAFRFGPQYAAATGHSLLDGYRRQGRWTLVVFTLLTLGTMFTLTAVVTLVAAGVAIAAFRMEQLLASTVGAAQGPIVVSAVLLALCAGLLSSPRWSSSSASLFDTAVPHHSRAFLFQPSRHPRAGGSPAVVAARGHEGMEPGGHSPAGRVRTLFPLAEVRPVGSMTRNNLALPPGTAILCVE